MDKKYETKTGEITSKELPGFSKYHIKRDLRPKHVEEICLGIEKEKKVFGTIVLNIRDGEKRIIDGNHRFKAIEMYLQKNPDCRVGATFDIYKDATDEEEKEIFILRNDVQPQNKMDYVQTQCYDTFIYKALIDKKKHFPFSISLRHQTKMKLGHIPFQRLIEPYIQRNLKSFRGLSTTDLLSAIKQMGEDDFNNLKEFGEMYVDIFGQPEPETTSTKAAFLISFQRLYWSAIGEITKNEFFKRMKENYPHFHGRIKEKTLGFGVDAQIIVYQVLLDCLNYKAGGARSTKVKSFLSG